MTVKVVGLDGRANHHWQICKGAVVWGSVVERIAVQIRGMNKQRFQMMLDKVEEFSSLGIMGIVLVTLTIVWIANIATSIYILTGGNFGTRLEIDDKTISAAWGVVIFSILTLIAGVRTYYYLGWMQDEYAIEDTWGELLGVVLVGFGLFLLICSIYITNVLLEILGWNDYSGYWCGALFVLILIFGMFSLLRSGPI